MQKKLIKKAEEFILKSLLALIAAIICNKFLSLPYILSILFIIAHNTSKILVGRLDTKINFFELIKYIYFLLKEIIISSFKVCKIIWNGNLKISPKFAVIQTINNTELGMTIFANSITLTPGTISISIDKNNILIHSLEENSVNELKNSDFDIRIKKIFI